MSCYLVLKCTCTIRYCSVCDLVHSADEEDVIYALNSKDTARALGLQAGAAKVLVCILNVQTIPVDHPFMWLPPNFLIIHSSGNKQLPELPAGDVDVDSQ